jgi:hypothetical protein
VQSVHKLYIYIYIYIYKEGQNACPYRTAKFYVRWEYMAGIYEVPAIKF